MKAKRRKLREGIAERKKAPASGRGNAPSGPPPLEYTATEVNTVLFPAGKRVRLACGEDVQVRPWSVEMFGEMAQRIPNTLIAATPDEDGKAMESDQLPSLILELTDEVIYMVARTIGWSEKRVREEMPFEELVSVATVVWDVCIAGSMGKIGGLMGRVIGMIAGVKATPTRLAPAS